MASRSKTEPATRRILLVTPQSPFGEASGSRQRTRLFYDALSRLATTDVLVVEQGEQGTAPAPAEHVFHVTSHRKVSLRPYGPDPLLTAVANSVLPQPIDAYTLVVGRYLWSLCQLGLPKNVPSIVDLDDFSYRYAASGIGQPRQLLPRIKRRLKELVSRRALRRFHGSTFVTERDQPSRLFGRSVVCPNIAPAPPAPTQNPTQQKGTPESLLFVGSMWYGPNRDGIEWFLASVWPQVQHALPRASLRIIGAAPAHERARWSKLTGVSAPGFVDDLAQAYASVDAVIVPVWYGGGSNIKLLEALAHTKPCIASSFTHRAFDRHLHDNEHLLVANDADDFVKHCITALRNPNDLLPMAQRGAACVHDHFNAGIFAQRLHELAACVAPALRACAEIKRP